MKTLKVILTFLLPLYFASAQNLSPYILGFETTETTAIVNKKLQANLEQNGIKNSGRISTR